MRASVLILLLAAAPAAAAPEADDAAEEGAREAPAPQAQDDADADFEEDRPTPSIALGPVQRGRPFASLDLGWLRSGVRFDLGLGARIDLTLRVDTMLLYEGLDGQTGIHVGLRWSPLDDPLLRGSVQLSAGQVLVPTGGGNTVGITHVTGDLLLGTEAAGVALVYGRVTVRGVRPGAVERSYFAREVEAGLGVERGWRRFVFGAEGFVLNRPGHAGLREWRLRAGMSF